MANEDTLRDVRDNLGSSTDAFDKLIADGTRNTVDIPAIYDFNNERHRLKENGTRVAPEDISGQFSDNADSFTLSPDAGNTIDFHTAERPRYIVGYEAAASTAGMLNQSLESGDTYEVGLRDYQDPENKAFFEFNGGGDNRIVLVGSDTEVATETFTLPEGLNSTDPIRYEIQFNAYNVGRYQFKVSYTDSSKPIDSKQQNEIVGELAVDDDFAIGDFNHHIYHELDATTAGKSVEAGSFGYIVLGNVEETTRDKGASLRGLSYGGSGEFEALAALRVKPGEGNVYTQMKNVSVFPDGGGGELLVAVFQAGETDATGFDTPPEMSARNTVIETTTNVSEFVDSTGTTVTSTNDPNGYQIGLTTYESSGQGSQTRTQPSVDIENKRPLYEDDVALFLYKADSATARSVNLNYFIEQDW